MKNIKLFTLILLVLSLVFTPLLTACNNGEQPVDDNSDNELTEAEKAGNVIYVAVSGSDTDGDGSKEKPYATIPAARDAIRAKKAETGLPDGGITVLIEEGTYRITEPIVLETGDSGEDGKPITYKAVKDAEVIIDGGVKLEASMFEPVNEEFKAILQTEDAKANVVQIDLEAAGCYFLEPFVTYTWGGGIIYNITHELFADSARQYVAQWPNREDGYAYSKLVSKKTGESFPNGSNSYYELEIPEGKAELWHDSKIVSCTLFFNGWETAHTSSGWHETNLENGSLRVYAHTHMYEFNEQRPYYLINIAPELDVPGEYYIDPDTNVLYYYPDGNLEELNLVFSQVSDYLVRLNDVSYISFDGITFEHGRGTGITAGKKVYEEGEEVVKTTDITVKNCTFRALGGAALCIYNTDNALIDHNEFYELGCAGIEVCNDDYTVRNPSNNKITNNLIHDWAQFYPTENPAISIQGMGFYVAHNEMYESTHTGIRALVGDSLIEYNIIHDISKMSGDAGAIYNGDHGWAEAGCVYRYNYIYNLHFESATALRPNAIYLDDQLQGQYVYGNILKNISGNGIAIGGGKDMIIRNNIMIDMGGVAVGSNNNGVTFQTNDVRYNGPESDGYFGSIENMDYTNELLAAMCPELLLMIEVGYMSNNIDDAGIPAYQIFENNVVYDLTPTETVDPDETYTNRHEIISIDGVTNGSCHTYLNGAIRNNLLYTIDPGFTTIGKVDCALKDDSQVFCDIYSFEQIPYELIGIIE